MDTGGRLVQPLSSAVSLGNYQPLTFHQSRDLDGSWQRSCLKATQAAPLASLSEGVLGAAAVVKSSAGCDCKATYPDQPANVTAGLRASVCLERHKSTAECGK